MVFLKPSTKGEAGLNIQGEHVYMRPLVMSDYADWARLRALSREHLVPWEPEWQRDELSKSSFRRRIRHYQREAREDLGYAYGIFDETGAELRGGITLSNIRRGVSQAGTLGYWLGLPFVGGGVMTSAVGVFIPHVFGELGLHRIEAALMPRNVASLRVLERNNFRREGFARKYLKINGRWEDHILYGLLRDDFRRVREGSTGTTW